MYRLILKRTGETLRHNKKFAGFAYKSYSTRTQPLEAGFGKYLIILSPFIAGGGVVAYAKYDNDFRKTLVKNVPAVEPILEVLLDDANPLADIQNKIDEYTKSITGFFGGSSSEKSKIEVKPIKKVDKIEPVIDVEKSATTTSSAPAKTSSIPVPAPPLPKPAASTKTSTPAESKSVKSTEKPPATVPELPKPKEFEIPKDITELEKAVEQAALTAMQEYSKVVKVLKSYNEEVKKIVDSSVENIDPSSWMVLKNKTLTRDNMVRMAECAAQEANEKLAKLEQQLEKVAANAPEELKSSIKNKINLFSNNLKKAKSEVYQSKDLAGMSENYWKKVEAARSYFVNEIESLFGVNLNDKKWNLSKEDVDLFLVNAYSHVMAYQKELQKLQTEGDLRLRRALDAIRGSDQSETVKAQLEYELEK
jgi:mitofilin